MRYSIIILLCSVLFISCSTNKVKEFSASQKVALKLLPSDSRFIIYMNLDNLRKSDLWQNNLKQSMPGAHNSQTSNIDSILGFSLVNKSKELYISLTEKENLVKLFVLYDNWTNILREKLSSNEEVLERKIEGKTFYKLKNKNTFYYFFDKILLESSDSTEFSNYINNRNLNILNNSKFVQISKDIFDKSYYWFVSDDPQFLESISGLPNKSVIPRQLLSSINGLSLAAAFGSDCKIEFNILCGSVKNALIIENGFKTASSMGLLNKGDKTFDYIISKIESSRDENKVQMRVNLNKSEINNLKNNFKN